MNHQYEFWSFGPTGTVHLVQTALKHYMGKRIDTSDEAHYGDGTWCCLGKDSGGRRVESVLNSVADVLAAEQGKGVAT